MAADRASSFDHRWSVARRPGLSKRTSATPPSQSAQQKTKLARLVHSRSASPKAPAGFAGSAEEV